MHPADNHYARTAYLQAITVPPKKYHFGALVKLATIYDYALGVEQDLNKTKEYLEIALATTKDQNAGDYLSRVKLRLQYPTVKSAEEWASLGNDFYVGRNGREKNLFSARMAFEQAKLLDSKYTEALYSLGWMHFHGEGGLVADYNLGEQYYKFAAEEGSTAAQAELIKMRIPNLKSAFDWWNLGTNYLYYGQPRVLEAQTCFEQAIKIDPKHGKSLHLLGTIFEKHKSNGLVTAAKYYQRADEAGWSSKQDLERIFSSNTTSAPDLNGIGAMYHSADGKDGISRSYQQAARWYEKAKSKGNAVAVRNLGLLYEYGNYYTQNFLTAAACYQHAFTLGYEDAKKDLERLLDRSDITGHNLNEIGLMYHNGAEGIVIDYVQAAKWFEQAAKKNFGAGYRNIGFYYAHGGYGYAQDFEQAARHYFLAIHYRYPATTDFLAMIERPDITIAKLGQLATMLRGYNATELADSCEAQAALKQELAAVPRHIGFQYEVGTAQYPKNFLLAAKHYQQSLEKGYCDAQTDLDRLFNLATISGEVLNEIGEMYHYADGKEGIARNYTQAARWYEQAKAKGSATARRNLGVLYEYGNHYLQNFLTAATCYQQAVTLGYENARKDLERLLARADITGQDLNAIGLMYHNGNGAEGIVIDYVQAAKWFEQAAKKNFGAGYRNIGAYYAHGGYGYAQNFEQAARHYILAIQNGYADANSDFQTLINRPEMTSETLGQLLTLLKAHNIAALVSACEAKLLQLKPPALKPIDPPQDLNSKAPVVNKETKPEPPKLPTATLINQLGILAKPKERRVQRKIQLQELGLIATPGSYVAGNCLFDAFAVLLPDRTSASYRAMAVDYIRSHQMLREAIQTDIDNGIDNFIKRQGYPNITYHSVDEYLNTMSLDKAWGTHYEIVAIAEKLNRPIVYFKLSTINGEENIITNISIENDCDQEPLILEWNGSHYSPCKLAPGRDWRTFMQQVRSHNCAIDQPRNVTFKVN